MEDQNIRTEKVDERIIQLAQDQIRDRTGRRGP